MAGLHRWLGAWATTLRAMVAGRADQRGQNGLEYALVAGVVVVAIISAFTAFPIAAIVSGALTKVKDLVA